MGINYIPAKNYIDNKKARARERLRPLAERVALRIKNGIQFEEMTPELAEEVQEILLQMWLKKKDKLSGSNNRVEAD